MSDADSVTDLRQANGPHVFVDDLSRPILLSDDEHHLRRSLRLVDGDSITLSDGRHSWVSARLGVEVEVTGEVVTQGAAAWTLTLVIALAKGTKPELAVQKATEIGVDRIVIGASDRSVVRWDEAKSLKNRDRLQRVAREASMQSRRVTVPEITIEPDLTSMLCAAPTAGLVRADFDGEALDATHHIVAIGPEGGWSDRERAAAPAAIDLGPTVLRAETAAIVAAARMVWLRTHADPCD